MLPGMKKPEVTDAQSRLIIRELTLADLEGIQQLHRRCFPGMLPWTREQVAAQVERFPEGQIGIEMDGQLVATSSSLIVNGDTWEGAHTFDAASGDGLIGTHEPDRRHALRHRHRRWTPATAGCGWPGACMTRARPWCATATCAASSSPVASRVTAGTRRSSARRTTSAASCRRACATPC
jgi:hypothetical protein